MPCWTAFERRCSARGESAPNRSTDFRESELGAHVDRQRGFGGHAQRGTSGSVDAHYAPGAGGGRLVRGRAEVTAQDVAVLPFRQAGGKLLLERDRLVV